MLHIPFICYILCSKYQIKEMKISMAIKELEDSYTGIYISQNEIVEQLKYATGDEYKSLKDEYDSYQFELNELFDLIALERQNLQDHIIFGCQQGKIENSGL